MLIIWVNHSAPKPAFASEKIRTLFVLPILRLFALERIATTGLPKKFFPGAPDLAVEVMSPDDRADEVTEKVLDWLSAGCRAVWVLDGNENGDNLSFSDRHSNRRCRRELADDTIVPDFAPSGHLFPGIVKMVPLNVSTFTNWPKTGTVQLKCRWSEAGASPPAGRSCQNRPCELR